MSMTRSPAEAPFRARDRLTPPERRRRRSLAGEGGISLLLHVLVIIALVATVTHQHMNDVTDGSTVAVVFEGGPKATTPETQESRQSHPRTAPDVNSKEPAPEGATPPSQASPTAQPRVQQQEQEQHPPAPPATPAPAEPAPAVPEGAAPLQLPPPAQSSRQPAHARPLPRPSRPVAPASPFAALSAPMNLSLAGRPPPLASEGHLQRGILLSMAPTEQNRNIMTRYAEARHKLGEDWWAAFSRFVEEHKYYPMSAAARGEDGQCVLPLTIERDGTVKSVRLELSSGSPTLDMAWISEFRGAKVPAFPPGTEESEVDFPASMTYILEHM
jgi:protein TonB